MSNYLLLADNLPTQKIDMRESVLDFAAKMTDARRSQAQKGTYDFMKSPSFNPVVSVTFGNRYARLWVNDKDICCAVDMEDGDVLFASSWINIDPSQTCGNIFEPFEEVDGDWRARTRGTK